MTDKELNMKIYEAILERAKQVFARLVPSNERSFTAHEVDLALYGKPADKEKYGYMFKPDSYQREEIEIEVGSFKCKFLEGSVFSMLHQFQKLIGIPKEQYHKFVKMKKNEHNFVIRLKGMGKMRKATRKKRENKNDNLVDVALYTKLDAIVASDGHIARYEPYELISGTIPENKNEKSGYYFCLPNDIKDGDYTVWYGDGANSLTWTNADGYQATTETIRFPNFAAVLPMLSEDNLMMLSSKEVSAIGKFVKSKNLKDNTLVFTLPSCNKEAAINVTDTSKAGGIFTISAKVHRDKKLQEKNFFFLIKTDYFKQITSDWDGVMYYQSPKRALIFQTKSGGIILQMPMSPDDFLALHPTPYDEIIKGVFNAGELIRDLYEDKNIELNEEKEIIPEEKEVKKEKKFTVCITGTLDHSRKWYESEISKRGWVFTNRMSKQVDLLVYGDYGDTATGKVKLAMELGTETMSGSEFYRLLEERSVPSDVVDETNETIEEQPDEPADVEEMPIAEEVHEDIESPSPRSAEGVGRYLIPLLIIETEEYGTIKVAGNSTFEKLYDQEREEFTSEAAAAKFDEITAFIPDELISEDPLNFEAIGEAVDAFLEEVEEAV